MKKIFSIFAFTALFLTSCSEVEEPNIGLNNNWLQYDQTAYAISEGDGGSIKIPVMLAAGSNPNGVDVNFTVDASTLVGYTISPSNGVLRIEPGKFVAYIVVTPINDTSISADVVIDFSFGDNAIAEGLAGQGLKNTSTTLTIIEDDCPFDINEFVGTYSAAEDGYVDSNGDQIYYNVTATLGTTPGTLMLSNLWDVNGTSTATLDFSNPASPRITFKAGGEFLYTSPSRGGAVIAEPSDVGDPSTPSTFKTCSKEMDVYFYVYFYQAGTWSSKAHIILTKK